MAPHTLSLSLFLHALNFFFSTTHHVFSLRAPFHNLWPSPEILRLGGPKKASYIETPSLEPESISGYVFLLALEKGPRIPSVKDQSNQVSGRLLIWVEFFIDAFEASGIHRVLQCRNVRSLIFRARLKKSWLPPHSVAEAIFERDSSLDQPKERVRRFR